MILYKIQRETVILDPQKKKKILEWIAERGGREHWSKTIQDHTYSLTFVFLLCLRTEDLNARIRLVIKFTFLLRGRGEGFTLCGSFHPKHRDTSRIVLSQSMFNNSIVF